MIGSTGGDITKGEAIGAQRRQGRSKTKKKASY